MGGDGRPCVRIEGESCHFVDIHPGEGNKPKARFCCLMVASVAVALRFNALLCVKCFHFLLIFPLRRLLVFEVT